VNSLRGRLARIERAMPRKPREPEIVVETVAGEVQTRIIYSNGLLRIYLGVDAGEL